MSDRARPASRLRGVAAAVAALAAALLATRCGPSDAPICAEPGRVACEDAENCTLPSNPCMVSVCRAGCCDVAPARPGKRVLVYVDADPGGSCSRLVCDVNGDTVCAPPTCGDGVCAPSEDCASCAEDCPCESAFPSCGDQVCQTYGGENCANCAADCGTCCGDGVCQTPYETCAECAEDCCPPDAGA